jgi:hypothetical protein
MVKPAKLHQPSDEIFNHNNASSLDADVCRNKEAKSQKAKHRINSAQILFAGAPGFFNII